VITRLHAALLHLYPRQFRADFGEEMEAVFEEAAARSPGRGSKLSLFLRELRDLPSSVVEAYATDRLLGGDILMNGEPISPSTRWQAFLALLPFLAFGASSMIGKVDHTYHLRGLDAEMVVYSLALAGLLIGWVRGFPLWSYSYLGWSFVLAWANTNMKVYGVEWGYRIWIPFGITVLIGLIWTHSFQPIKKFLSDIWNDWTRLSLAMYALGAWMLMIYDENHHPQLLAFILASTLVAAAAVWLFLRSSTIRGRILSILAGFIIALIIGGISEATWDWHEYYGIPKKPTTWYKKTSGFVLMSSLWGLILFWPAIIGIIRRTMTRRTA
jgi:hypothetical protein